MLVVKGIGNQFSCKVATAVSLLLMMVLLLSMSGCSSHTNKGQFRVDHQAADFLQLQKLQQPTVANFQVCAAQGCDRISTLSYENEEWQRIARLFETPVISAQQERQRISQAVALAEQLVGGKNGTAYDYGRNAGLFSGHPQLDCVAESANTTVAMMLLQQQGMLKYHRVIYPHNRNILSFRMAHYSAAIEERETQRRFAVDSWFFDNGKQPVIVPIEDWKDGYDPES